MIYFDHAATGYPKPPEVIDAVCNCLKTCAGNAGRGAYRSSLRASELLYTCRAEAAALFGADSPENVIFTAGVSCEGSNSRQRILSHCVNMKGYNFPVVCSLSKN